MILWPRQWGGGNHGCHNFWPELKSDSIAFGRTRASVQTNNWVGILGGLNHTEGSGYGLTSVQTRRRDGEATFSVQNVGCVRQWASVGKVMNPSLEEEEGAGRRGLSEALGRPGLKGDQLVGSRQLRLGL